MTVSLPQAGSPSAFLQKAIWLLPLLLAALPGSATWAAEEASEPARLAEKSLLLDLAAAGDRLVVVGDRGHVLLSDDQGRSWRQIIVPTRAMLTGVSFGDATHGWAAGHDGVILATSDGGLTWHRQDSGRDPDTVWLDVHFHDATHGLVVGAYGKGLLTEDGGRTWQPTVAPLDEVHLNHIGMDGRNMTYLSGEAGTLLTSDNPHGEWHKLAVPYDGSLYGTVMLPGNSILLHGLRGHVFVSTDGGEHWAPREVGVPVLIMAGLVLKSGPVVLAGTGGNFFVSRDGARTFATWKPAEYNGGAAALLETTDGALVVAGELGVARLDPPAEAAR